MDLYNRILNKGDIESIIELTKEDKKIITRLYSYETIFSKTLNYLLVNKNKSADLEYLFTIFIDMLSGRFIKLYSKGKKQKQPNTVFKNDNAPSVGK